MTAPADVQEIPSDEEVRNNTRFWAALADGPPIHENAAWSAGRYEFHGRDLDVDPPPLVR